MLSYFHHFVVDGVPHVDVYQDDEDPLRFYLMPGRLRIARLPSGEPDVQVYVFARDLSLMAGVREELPPGEIEGGLLNFTVEASVPAEDQERIKAFLRSDVLSGRRPVQRAAIDPDGAIRTRWRTPVSGEPVLAYPTWVEGTAQATLPSSGGATFVRAGDSVRSPSLTSSNTTSFSIALSQEGARLFREALEKDKLPMEVAYTLKYAARLPNLSIRIHGEIRDVYRQVKEHSTIVESSNGVPLRRYPQVSSLEELKEKVGALTVQIDENAIAEARDPALVTELKTMALTLANSYLTSIFTQPVVTGQLDPAKLGTDPLQNFRDPNVPGKPNNQMWLKNFEQVSTATLDMTFNSNVTQPFAIFPSASLIEMVGAAGIRAAFVEADLNTPLFHVLQVPVRVTADFERDPIAAVQVSLDYRQTDDRTNEVKARKETFDFVTGDEVYHFRTTMAKARDGAPKDDYTYTSTIHYEASSRSTTVGPSTTDERSLMIGYDRLSCVSVQCTAGGVPWTVVDAVEVSLSLPGANLSSADADFVLSQAAPTAGWFTYAGAATSLEYTYDCVYRLKGGGSIARRGMRSAAATLLIDSPFTDRMQVVFVPQGTFPPLQRIVVSPRYDDGTGYRTGDTHEFTDAAGTWNWTVDLREGAERTFTYQVAITYADGTTSSHTYEGTEGTVLVGDVASALLEVEVTPVVLDMADYRLVVVRLRHTDPRTGRKQEKMLQFTQAEQEPQSWKVPLDDAASATYGYDVELYDLTGRKTVVTVEDATDRLLVLQAPVTA